MIQKTIPQLRALLRGTPSEKVTCSFEYLNQRGILYLNKLAFQFPLWPTYQLSPILEFSQEQALEFWRLVSKHWVHPTSFLDEEILVKGQYHSGFICVQCGIRALIPSHTYVSVPLVGAALRGHSHIQARSLVFQVTRLHQIGIYLEEDTVRQVASQRRKDPVLDAWTKEESP